MTGRSTSPLIPISKNINCWSKIRTWTNQCNRLRTMFYLGYNRTTEICVYIIGPAKEITSVNHQSERQQQALKQSEKSSWVGIYCFYSILSEQFLGEEDQNCNQKAKNLLLNLKSTFTFSYVKKHLQLCLNKMAPFWIWFSPNVRQILIFWFALKCDAWA